MNLAMFDSSNRSPLEQSLAVVEKRITSEQAGRVKCFGSHWPAKLNSSDRLVVLEPGDYVVVVGMQNITLLVAPEPLSRTGNVCTFKKQLVTR